jgi:hypothetical protein
MSDWAAAAEEVNLAVATQPYEEEAHERSND